MLRHPSITQMAYKEHIANDIYLKNKLLETTCQNF